MSEPQINQPINLSSFAEWCKHKDSLSEEAIYTVEVLLNKAGTSDCNEADRILSNLTELNLDWNEITDFTPLSALTNLTYLNLSSNQITDITGLSALTNLTYLNLSANQITDITGLSALTNLTHLNLSANQITDITGLSALTNLTYLNLENNQITDLNLSSELIVNSTEPVDRTRAAAAIEFAYAALGKTSPKFIIFCKSPQAAITELTKSKFVRETADFRQSYQQLESGCRPFNLIRERPNFSKLMRWESQLEQEVGVHFYDYRNDSWPPFTRKYLLGKICVADFCVSVLRIVLNPDAQKAWECLKQLLTECGWIFMFEKICYVCDRPIKLSLDSEYNLHAEGESAIEFPDGYKIYSYHGVTLPEKYGQLHPNQWQASWILSEKNVELRRLLIERIGYDRLCCELQAVELDTWQEYTLLKIDNADVEPIYLLKMTCPSTGHIHALRVPPDVRSAKEAIRWVNWDIDPEDFSVQT
ncbi:leucine-rich repeat domain-containing protein [Microcoleus sp. Pol7_A1]|uniref:leucine-rich repeat domain-containing protein n=1 Tax=Microcoleus sp. Pol7_A1 TaxID=2818893 RepID=UPI002FCF593E